MMARALLTTASMDRRLKRFDLFFAVATAGAVSVFGDDSTRGGDVFCLLSLWVPYLRVAPGMRLIHERKLRSAPVN